MVRSRRFFPRSRVKATFPHILKKKEKNLRICLIWLHFLPTALITDLADCKLDLIIKALLPTVAERLALKRRY